MHKFAGKDSGLPLSLPESHWSCSQSTLCSSFSPFLQTIPSPHTNGTNVLCKLISELYPTLHGMPLYKAGKFQKQFMMQYRRYTIKIKRPLRYQSDPVVNLSITWSLGLRLLFFYSRFPTPTDPSFIPA